MSDLPHAANDRLSSAEMAKIVEAIGCFSIRLRALRLHLGMTEEEMASVLGIPLRRYRAHEAGRRPRRRIEMIVRLAETTGVSCDWLVTGSVPCSALASRRDDLPLSRRGQPLPVVLRVVSAGGAPA